MCGAGSLRRKYLGGLVDLVEEAEPDETDETTLGTAGEALLDFVARVTQDEGGGVSGMAIDGSASASVSLRNLATSDSEQATITMGLSGALSFAEGTGAGLINKIWQDTRTLTDGGNETLDLSPTPTSGITGIVTFTAVKVLLVKAADANTTNITVTGTLLAKPPAVLKPGAVYLFTDPSAAGSVVGPGTGDTMIMTNSAGAAASYSVIVGGI